MTPPTRLPLSANMLPTLAIVILAAVLAAGCTGNFGSLDGGGQKSTPAVTGTETTPFPATTSATPTLLLTTPATAPPTPAPEPVPVPARVLALGQPYTFDDHTGKQVISLSVDSFEQKQTLYYPSGFDGSSLSRRDPAPGYRFVLVGVEILLVGLHGEGLRTHFMTPLATSFTLWDGTLRINATDPEEFVSGTSYYLKDEGSLYHSRLIDKETPGDGLLVFEVPTTLPVRSSMIRFCPVNDPVWKSMGYPRCDDEWDCDTGTVAWRLS